jgi:hypothetical protein
MSRRKIRPVAALGAAPGPGKDDLADRLPTTSPAPPRQILLIERIATADCESGQPWPPALLDRWHLVHSTDGTTLWRRISLVTNASGE